MTKEDCFYLGKIIKPFSFKGELVLFFDVDDPQQYGNLDSVYVSINNMLVKYDIKTIRPHGNKFVVSFKDVDEQQSTLLVGKELYLPLEMLPELTGNKFYFHEVIGFRVIDKEKGDIGTVKEFIDSTTQPIMCVDFNGKEILIPVIDEVIDNLDRKEGIIYITAPQGLIDIYL